MEARRVIICCAPEDGGASLSISTGLAASDFECRPSGIGEGSLNPGDFQWADVMVVLLSAAANGSARVLRDVEEAVSSGLRIVPVRLDGTPPSSALRYYLGPFQWVEPDRGGEYSDRLVKALTDDGIVAQERGRIRKIGRIGVSLAVLVAGAVIALVLPGLLSGGGGDESEHAVSASPDSCDIVIISPQNLGTLTSYLASLGYSVETVPELPGPAELGRFDLIILDLQGSPDLALPLYEFLCSGGSLLLMAGQPYFMEMPTWIGMETYSNYWGADFPIIAACDTLLGIRSLDERGVLIYYTSFVDGAAVLKDPTTAVVDACFNGEDSLAAAIRNTVGTGRLAWLTACPEPFADVGGNLYSTDGFERYLEALYAWLDRDGPEGTP
jgi:hypothetical protein